MPVREFHINHDVGLHARPAAEFVKLTSSFPCEVMVKNLTEGSDYVNAKSILAVLTLGVSQGHIIQVQAEGEQANETLEALKTLIESDFGKKCLAETV
jgi:phosphotransferase system HPr (HPr) family protein